MANCDLDDSPNTNFIQNGAPDAAALRYDGDVLDAVSYEGNTGAPYTEGSGVGLADSNTVAGLSISRCEDGSDTDQNNVDFVTVGSTPGAENKCGAQSLEAFVHEVQGSGSSVAITDLVVVEAIVVGDFQGSDQLLGFFIQEEDDDADSDPLTSEGILVFCGECAQDAAVGDKVQVTGWPGEYFGMSQIDATGTDGQVTIVSADNTLPTASTVDLPAAGSTVSELALEYVEGMLVTFPDTLVVSEYFQLARFGQLVLTADERPRQFTDANEPDVDNYAAFLNDLSSRRIILDDDNNRQNDALGTPDKPYYWPRPGLSIDNLIRGGDSIDNLTGVLHWSWAGSGGTDAWRVRPVNEAFGYGFTRSIPRPAAPDDVGGSLKVASFNVLNYFTTIDEGPDICGPDGNLDCRGAHSTRELSRQREKIVSAMITMDADVIGLMELENNTSAAMRDLVGGLNSVAGPGVYDFVDTGTIGNDAIKVGFIYKTDTVFPVGDFAIVDSSVDPTFNDDKNRPALAQTFEATADRAKLTVVVNHLKSKGSPCDDVGDPNLNDGQGNCNQTRTDAAVALVNWLGTDPTNSNDPDFMIVGDLNSYRMEEPIDALKMGGYTDLLNAVIGPEAYTYLFDGQLGYLDYAMANGTLSGQVTGVTAWNINADEIPLFDYNDEILDPGERSFERESDAEEIYESNAFRASDHDPVLVGLDLNGPPVCSEAGPSIGSLWSPNHKFVEVMVLGVTDPEADPITINVDSIFQDEAVNSDGDGNTAPDAAGIGTSVAQVRSERDGRGNGRVYHISFTASDDAGNSCSGTVNVGVPANRGNEATAVDDGPLFDATIAGP
ncbi:MAG: ExeM/NucH family extracellular endonuclease [Chloroflexota bacterium]|nr:MAG: ExeM/NucH family extracellular endonuclease [Chloroflexota bacterium]